MDAEEAHQDSGPRVVERVVKRSCLRKQLRKTKMCQHFEKGECSFAEDCAFAHSPSEIQSIPDLRKTRLCPNFTESNCTDKECSFAHGEAELRSTDLFFKKTLCIWNEKGKCRAGDQCRFAHGSAELRGLVLGEDGIPSAGSRGHPEACAAPCKYYWRERGCKDSASCNRCHLCPWRPGSSSGRSRKRVREDSEESRGAASVKRLRGAGSSRLDMYGNSRPSWLSDECSSCRISSGFPIVWDPWKVPAPMALPGYGQHYVTAQPPHVCGYGAMCGYLSVMPVQGHFAAPGWVEHGARAAYPGIHPRSVV